MLISTFLWYRHLVYKQCSHYVVCLFGAKLFWIRILTGDDWNDGFADVRFLWETAQLKHVCLLRSQRRLTCFQSLSRQSCIPHIQHMASWGETSLSRGLTSSQINISTALKIYSTVTYYEYILYRTFLGFLPPLWEQKHWHLNRGIFFQGGNV